MWRDDGAKREIDTRATVKRFARGWHCLGQESQFRGGGPCAVEAFGTKLVVFADSHGTLHVLDAYCRHMGGDLSRGSVKQDSLACPFHDWRWGGNGRCTAVPYARRIPKLARTRAWLSCEQNGLLFVWHDPEGNPPPPDLAITRIDEVFDEEWSDWTLMSALLEHSHAREVMDNFVDNSHFFYIHGTMPSRFGNVFEGQTASLYQTSLSRADSPDMGASAVQAVLYSESHYLGPAYSVTRLRTDYAGFQTEALVIAFNYPVTHDSFKLHQLVSVRRPAGLDDRTADLVTTQLTAGVRAGFEQDVDIFEHKAKLDNPLLCDDDGPVYQLRRWYEQFFVDVADISEDMVARYEHEVDTTFAMSVWTDEVEQNLARRKAYVAKGDA